MLQYTPYRFDLNASLPRYLRDSAHRMISFANRSGECWFSVRTFGRVAGLSKSSASRHLALLTRPEYAFAGRRWVPGVGYLYRIEARWLARGAVSHGRAPGVPRPRIKEESAKNKGFSAENRWKRSGDSALPPALNPKIIGHALPCACPNCARWVKQQQPPA